MMQLTEALQEFVLPFVRRGEGRIVPCDAAKAAEHCDGFIEAYPYEAERHAYYEMFWVLNGEATMKIDGRIYRLMPGDFCFLPPLLAHADVFDDRTPAYQTLWFACWPDAVGSHLFSYQPVGQWEVLAYSMALGTPQIWSVLHALHAEISGLGEMRDEAIRGLLLQLGVLLLRVLKPTSSSHGTGFYVGSASRRVLLYLREQYAQDIELGAVAHAVGLSPHYLTSVFKKETGKTIFHVLTEIRLGHAKRLIVEERLPIHKVAAAVGFSSPHHFSRVFRRVEGVPPSHFQK